MTFRRLLFWSHLAAGVTTGLVILLMAATGVLLTYERQLIAWAESRAVVAPEGQAPLGADALVAAAIAAGAEPGTAVTFPRDPGDPVRVSVDRHSYILLNPYTGEKMESAAAGTKALFNAVTLLHLWLALPEGARGAGRAITGAANLIFMFMALSGVVLWWPKLLRWRVVRNNLLFRRGLPSTKARDYNWHHVLGAWALVPLLAIAVSGVVFSYSWAAALVPGGSDEDPHGLAPARQAEGAEVYAASEAPTGGLAGGAVSVAALLEAAQSEVPGARTLSLALPEPFAPVVRVVADTGNGVQFTRQTTLTISREDGEVLAREDANGAPSARAYLRYLHTGEVYGPVGQTFAGLASLAAVVLGYTGLALSWRRLVSPVLAQRRPSIPPTGRF